MSEAMTVLKFNKKMTAIISSSSAKSESRKPKIIFQNGKQKSLILRRSDNMRKIDSIATNPAAFSSMQEWIYGGRSVQKFVLGRNSCRPSMSILEALTRSILM
jgi:hypothetical protein